MNINGPSHVWRGSSLLDMKTDAKEFQGQDTISIDRPSASMLPPYATSIWEQR